MPTEKLPIKIKLPQSFFLPEEKCGYNVTADQKLLWAVLLDLLVEFDRVCKKNNLLYSLDSGTLLGAIRHNGFIPWDNDIDVAMLREDYDKLCEIASREFQSPYYFQTSYNDPGSARRHGQLRNSATTMILLSEMQDGKPMYDFNQGVFLDVFILDSIPDNEEEIAEQQEEMVSLMNLLWNFKQYYFLSNKSPWLKDALLQTHKMFDDVSTRYNNTNQSRIANISLIPKCKEKDFIKKELYLNLKEHDFEGFLFPIPDEADKLLTAWYGDWTKFVIGEDSHGEILLDLEKPYTEYVKGLSPLTYNAGNKHPLVELYQHRDKLLQQRDVAWNDIDQLNKIIGKLRRYRKLFRVSMVVSFILFMLVFVALFLS